jgi:hypothetical protein
LLLLAFAVVPILVYIASIRPGGASIFLPRYMLPCWLGWSIACAHLSQRALQLFRRDPRKGLKRFVIAAQALAVLGLIGWEGRNVLLADLRSNRADPTGRILSSIPGDEPIVVEPIHVFMRWHFYSPDRSRLRFIVDPDAGLLERGGGPANHQIMAALKRQFPEQFAEVVPNGKFLAETPNFWVVLGGAQWAVLRLKDNPAYQVRFFGRNLIHVIRLR